VIVRALARTKATSVWLLLVGLTLFSWALGTQHASGGDDHSSSSVVICVVAVFKVRLVGMYFMELRDAPVALRGMFEGYCVALLGLLIGMYLVR
jgi:hypothetical protein